MKSAVCILCPRDNTYLSVSRRGNSSQWGLPGGKVDPGESNAGALERELKEETGISSVPTSFEPLFCGLCPGEVDYWVTTYIWTDVDAIKDSELVPEEGLSISWKTEKELCDPSISPFADYNRRIFTALNERNKQ